LLKGALTPASKRYKSGKRASGEIATGGMKRGEVEIGQDETELEKKV